jgi:hypothetical protein
MSKRGVGNISANITRGYVDDFINDYFPENRQSIIMPTKEQTVLTPPAGYIGIYCRMFKEGGVRYPFPTFLLDVLKHYGCHLSMMHPLGCARLIAFEVNCRAYGVAPDIDLFRTLCCLCPAGDWLTLGNRPKRECFSKCGLQIRDWKDEFVFMSVDLVPNDYRDLCDPRRLKIRKKGDFTDSVPGALSADLLKIYRVLVKDGILVETYPEGILFKAGIARRLAEGEEVYNGMYFLRALFASLLVIANVCCCLQICLICSTFEKV